MVRSSQWCDFKLLLGPSERGQSIQRANLYLSGGLSDPLSSFRLLVSVKSRFRDSQSAVPLRISF